jgi:hypothetical protein
VLTLSAADTVRLNCLVSEFTKAEAGDVAWHNLPTVAHSPEGERPTGAGNRGGGRAWAE